jgi:signal transduction histidine kinase
MSRTSLVYGLLLAALVLIMSWQVVEHNRVKEAARTALIKRSQYTAMALGQVIQSLGVDARSGRLVEQERLERALKRLVESELNSIALLNQDREVVVSAGIPIDIDTIGKMQTGEHWDARSVTVVRRVDLDPSERPGGESNRPPIVVSRRDAPPGPPRDRPRPNDGVATNSLTARLTNSSSGDLANILTNPSPAPPSVEPSSVLNRDSGMTNQDQRGKGSRRGPPPLWFWMRMIMSEEERKSMAEKRGLHGLIIVMSTDSVLRADTQDLWLRSIIGCFAGVSAIGLGVAWRNIDKSSDLQMRLLRAAEQNTHLREMNVAAAGLAHETRNPLNIIRGLAQMVSKRTDASEEVRAKSREITDEVDRVTAQLSEFINYSKPREVRWTPVALNVVVGDVVRALASDVEDKSIKLTLSDVNLTVDADEQLLRQVLFNLLINAIQAVGKNGEIQVSARKRDSTECSLEVSDNGPGVPIEQRQDIFKPYFTTHQKGTGLGLAVVQQNVLAHGWEVECLPNEPKGAIFRISRLRLSTRA